MRRFEMEDLRHTVVQYQYLHKKFQIFALLFSYLGSGFLFFKEASEKHNTCKFPQNNNACKQRLPDSVRRIIELIIYCCSLRYSFFT